MMIRLIITDTNEVKHYSTFFETDDDEMEKMIDILSDWHDLKHISVKTGENSMKYFNPTQIICVEVEEKQE